MAGIGVLAVFAALAGGGEATAAEGSTERADFTLEFTTQQPGAPTGASIHIVYRAAGDPNAKPSPIRRVLIEAPEGTRYGLDRFPACEASDEELRARGQAACPAGSKVGAGSLKAVTGFGAPFDPILAQVTLFNTGKGFLELVEQEQPRATLGLDRAVVRGSSAELKPPSTPGGPPDGQTAIRQIDLRFDRPGYITTPPACPAGGRWRSRGVFTFADGVTVAVPHSTPCAGAAVPRPRPRLRVSITPRRVRAGQRSTFRIRVRSDEPGCLHGARVRLGRHRARTDVRGRASIVGRLGRTGRIAVRARRPGCGRDTAPVRVLRP